MLHPIAAATVNGAFLLMSIVIAALPTSSRAQLPSTTAPPLGVADLLHYTRESEVMPSRMTLHCDGDMKLIKKVDDSNHVTDEFTHCNYFQDGNREDIAMDDRAVAGDAIFYDRLSRAITLDGKSLIQRQSEPSNPAIPPSATLFFNAARLVVGISHCDAVGGFVDGWPQLEAERLVDLVLASRSAAREGEEVIGGHLCTRVSAATEYGKYVLWLCPSDGYRIYQASCDKGPGNLLSSGARLPQRWDASRQVTAFSYFIGDIKFADVGSYRLGVSGSLRLIRQFDNGQVSETVTSVQRTRLDVDPKQYPQGAFVMDAIPEGAHLGIIGRPSGDHFSYMWKGGKAVLDSDSATTKAIGQQITQERSMESR